MDGLCICSRGFVWLNIFVCSHAEGRRRLWLWCRFWFLNWRRRWWWWFFDKIGFQLLFSVFERFALCEPRAPAHCLGLFFWCNLRGPEETRQWSRCLCFRRPYGCIATRVERPACSLIFPCRAIGLILLRPPRRLVAAFSWLILLGCHTLYVRLLSSLNSILADNGSSILPTSVLAISWSCLRLARSPVLLVAILMLQASILPMLCSACLLLTRPCGSLFFLASLLLRSLSLCLFASSAQCCLLSLFRDRQG